MHVEVCHLATKKHPLDLKVVLDDPLNSKSFIVGGGGGEGGRHALRPPLIATTLCSNFEVALHVISQVKQAPCMCVLLKLIQR